MDRGVRFICYSPWILLIFVLFTLSGHFDLCFIAYLIAMLHEAGHLIAAKVLGYNVAGVKIEPFGVCMNLSGEITDCRHELVISLAGPVANVIMITAGTLLTYINVNVPEVFFISNLYMLFINLLPVMPLDGGRIVNAVLKTEFGERKAKKIVFFLSVPVVCVIAVLGVILIFKSKINYSLLIISLFMCNNIRLRSDKSMDIVSLYISEVTYGTAKVFYVNGDLTVQQIVKTLPFEGMCIIYIVSNEGKVEKITTNKYVIGLRDSYFCSKISEVV